MRKVLFPLAAIAALSGPRAARADVTRCSSAPTQLTFSGTELPAQTGDTGWFPDGSPGQLEIVGRLRGGNQVAMGIAPTVCWQAGAMTLSAPAISNSGLLDAEYGAELDVYGQIHTSVLGETIDWSGQIPVPFVPSDLLLADTTSFDGTLLPDGAIASASDTTSRITVVSTNLLSEIISITGISGSLNLYVQGAMTTTYATSALTLGSGSIVATAGTLAVATPDAGFGASLAVPAAATGDVVYEPQLIFGVDFSVSILGISVMTIDLASVELPLLTIDRPITLAGDAANIPLPELAAIPVSLGFASGAAAELHLHNAGSAPLMLEVDGAPAGVTAAPVTIAAGADGAMHVEVAGPIQAGETLVLATNDPSHDTLSISLDADGSGQTNSDALPEVSAPGCAAAGSSDAGVLVVVALTVAFAGSRRARRRRVAVLS